MAPGVETRVLAAQVLDAVVHRGRSLKSELAAALPRLADPRDRALLEAIAFAALRGRYRYAPALHGWLQKPPGPNDGPLLALLLAGCAQLDALRLPAHAALDATVEAARALGRPHQAGLVNALLRRAQREGFPPADPAAAWPEWLRRRVEADWPDQAVAVFAASAQPAPLWLRVNPGRVSRADYLAQLQAAGIAAVADPGLADALRVDEPVPVHALPGFGAGLVSVQDGSAQQAADALAPDRGARVLDACAAPGGKTAQLLERAELELLALDSDPARAARIRDTLQRLRLQGQAQVRAVDARQVAQWWDGRPFDAILLDAPCSASGIVRRHPDIRWLRRADDLRALARLQDELLQALWPLLAPGGRLVYATCSIFKAEGEQRIDAFMQRLPPGSARLDPASPGHLLPLPDNAAAADAAATIAPSDGFFYALIHKNHESHES